MRYFANPYRDYDGTEVQVNPEVWLNKSRSVANVILSNIKHVESSIDGGLYVGPAGVAYALWKMSSFVTPQEASQLLAQADNLVNLNLMYVQRPDLQRDKQNKVGFLLGKFPTNSEIRLVNLVNFRSDGSSSSSCSHWKYQWRSSYGPNQFTKVLPNYSRRNPWTRNRTSLWQ